MAHHNQLGLSEPLELILGITYCASLASLVTLRHNSSKVYFTVTGWRIFYVSTLENILRILGRVYSTVARWRIKYGAQVGNILRIPGREYFTVDRQGIFYGAQVENNIKKTLSVNIKKVLSVNIKKC